MIKEETTLDMVEILSKSYELAELVCHSETMVRFLTSKEQLEKNKEAQDKIAAFQIKKEQYEEVQRFGKWHPDYNRITRETRQFKRELDSMNVVANYKKAEFELEELLHNISKSLASHVSESIKVPSDHPLLNIGSGGSCGTGCGTGGSCGCSS